MDGPDELVAYAQEVAAKTELLYKKVADALLSGDAQRVAALNAASGGYLGEMVLISWGMRTGSAGKTRSIPTSRP